MFYLKVKIFTFFKKPEKSGIRNDPNNWVAEVNNPRYILDLLLSVIRLSVETVEIVRGLPGAGFVEEKAVSPF